MDFRFLTHGIDTAEVCYYLDTRSPTFSFEALAVQRDSIDKKRRKHGVRIELSGKEFLLRASGSQSGFSFVISNPEWFVQFGEFNNPSFSVKYSSDALWHKGLDALQGEFLAWAAGLGLLPLREESLSRVDPCFDYEAPSIDFDEDNFITGFKKDGKHRGNRKPETFIFGKGTLLRVYDKAKEIREASQKDWFFDIWEMSENVWRIEWQFRKEALRQFGIVTLDDMKRSLGRLLTAYCHDHTSIRLMTEDSNSSRWPLHPLWADLQERIKSFGQQKPRSRELDLNKIPMRVQTNLVSMMGYIKHIAALTSLYDDKPPQTYAEILKNISAALSQLHDPLTWNVDVQDRIDWERLKNV